MGDDDDGNDGSTKPIYLWDYACSLFLFQLNSIILMMGEEIRVVYFQIIVRMITITQMEGS
jgi:hypothetical protein